MVEGMTIKFKSLSDERFTSETVGEIIECRFGEFEDVNGNVVVGDFYEVMVERSDLFCGVGFTFVYSDEIIF